jgi:hypothetical protein
VQRFIAGQRDLDAEYAVRALLALHWARSSVYEIHQRVYNSAKGDDVAAIVESSDKLRRAFQREFGRPPKVGEVRTRAAEWWDQLIGSNAMQVESMAGHFNQMMDWLEVRHLETLRVEPQRIDLVRATPR